MVDVALVGLGDIGLGAHLPTLLRHHDVRVAALVDPDVVRRERARALVGSRDLLVAEDIDGVLNADIPGLVLATPPWVTPALSVRALHAGRYVLAEKPVAPSVRDAEIYRQLSADEANRLQVGLTYRHDPAIQRLREWVAEKRLGHPLLVRAHIYDERLDPGDSEHVTRIRGALAHGLPVIHEGAHVLDWLSSILGGEAESIDDAWALLTDPKFPGPNLTGARLRYPLGTVALLEFGWLTEAQPRGTLSILGPRGYAELDTGTFTLTLDTGAGRESVEFPGERTARCFDRQLDRFTQLMNGSQAVPEPSLADGLAALETAEHIARMALRKEPMG